MSKRVKDVTEELVTPILEKEQLELVEIEYAKEGKNWFLRVFVDKEGGVDIEDCGSVSEQLSQKLDEHDPIPGAYFLEVSSPGAERPLKKQKDFERAIGRTVYVKTYEPIEGAKEFEGKLLTFHADQLEVEGEKSNVSIPYDKVAKARLTVTL